MCSAPSTACSRARSFSTSFSPRSRKHARAVEIRRFDTHAFQVLRRKGERVAVADEKIRPHSRAYPSAVGKAVLPRGVSGERKKGVPHGDLLPAEARAVRRRPQYGARRRFEGRGLADGGILMQREGNAQCKRAPRGRNARRPLFSEVFQVRFAPIADMRGEEGDGHAERRGAGELVVADDLPVNNHGADARAVGGGEPSERAEEAFRRAVSVAVREELRAAGGGKGARLVRLPLRHRRRSVSAAAVRLPQKGGPLLRRPVEKDLHAADMQAAFFVRRKAAERLVVVGGRGVGDHVRAQTAARQERLVEGKHFARKQPFLRNADPAREIVVLRLRKGGKDRVRPGHGYALRRREVLRLFERARAHASENAPRRGVEHSRVPRPRLQMQGARRFVQRVGRGKAVGVFHGNERVL